jgi:hypothetical protein
MNTFQKCQQHTSEHSKRQQPFAAPVVALRGAGSCPSAMRVVCNWLPATVDLVVSNDLDVTYNCCKTAQGAHAPTRFTSLIVESTSMLQNVHSESIQDFNHFLI